MTMYDPDMQANPQEGYGEPTLAHKVERAVKALDDNGKAIERWFWKGLIALNFIIGSVVLWLIVLHSA